MIVETLHITKALVMDILDKASLPHLIFLLISAYWILCQFAPNRNPTLPGAPIVGKRLWLEPTFLQRWRFVFHARDILSDGYAKYKDKPFVVRKLNGDVTIMPMRYLAETRLLPESVLSFKFALSKFFLPEQMNLNWIKTSERDPNMLKMKLTPEISRFIEMSRQEMEQTLPTTMPKPTSWTVVDVQSAIRTIIARMTTRAFMGHPACADPEWVKMSIDFTPQLLSTVFAVSPFPAWTHSILTRLLPSRYRTLQRMRYCAELVAARIEARRGGKTPPDDCLLDYMLDHGGADDVYETGQRQCMLALASNHTTAAAAINFLFDLCAHPEYFSILRDEVASVTAAHGRPGSPGVDVKTWLHALEKMDSFLTESLRHTPAILTIPQRQAMRDIVLQDGTLIPAGARIAFPSYWHTHEAKPTLRDPDAFDGLRYYKLRRGEGGDPMRYRSVQVDADHMMAFGYGSQACPGRHFATSQVKLVVARLLEEWDFAWPDGLEKPEIGYFEENTLLDPGHKLKVRLRGAEHGHETH
ncbi:hypothetical protein MCOR30_010531 [Pyricularia oryzae]|nr:hypothetical protein MCOR30_010531 [Pyricularia oryzae]